MTRSKHSRKGYIPLQRAGDDAPWMQDEKRRKRKRAEEDIRDELQ